MESQPWNALGVHGGGVEYEYQVCDEVSRGGWVVVASDTAPSWHHQVGSPRRWKDCDIPLEVGLL